MHWSHLLLFILLWLWSRKLTRKQDLEIDKKQRDSNLDDEANEMLVSISFSLYLKCLCIQETGSPGKRKKREGGVIIILVRETKTLCILRNTSHGCNGKVCNLASNSNSNHVNSSGRRDSKWKNVFMQVSRNESWEQSVISGEQSQEKTCESVQFYHMTNLLDSCKKQSWQTRDVSVQQTHQPFSL